MTGGHNPWSEADIAALRSVWCDGNVTIGNMGKVISRYVTKRSISQKAKSLGLPSRKEALGKRTDRSDGVPLNGHVPWTEEDHALLRELWFNENYSVIHISEMLPGVRRESAVSRRAKKLGLPSRRDLFPKVIAPEPKPRRLAKPRGNLKTNTCGFPVAMKPRMKKCGKPTTGRHCDFHARLVAPA